MVHSGSASPMKTTPASASPHLSVPATAAPLAPPPGDTTDQDQDPAQTPAKSLSTDLTASSDPTQPPTPTTPADAEPQPAVTPAKALAADSSPAPTPTPTPSARGLVNGRTSGRKRTPKACDCCGPNGAGHDVRTSGRGRGRGRGRARGRGAGGDLWDTPKRKVGGQLTHIKSFDLTREEAEEAEDDEDGYKKGQTTGSVAGAQAQTPFAPSQQDGPTRNNAAPEKGEEDASTEGSGDAGAGGIGGDESRDVEMRLSGVGGRGRGVSASKMEVGGGAKRGGGGGIIPRTYARPRPRQGPNKDVEMDHRGPPLGNGDTVNLSDTEPEEQAKEGDMVTGETENGQLSISAARSPRDPDSEMQVDQLPDETDSGSVPETLSNGNATTSPTDEDHRRSTLMEVETSHPATAVAPPPEGPITVSSVQHHWALRDHRLYCQAGTWEKEEEAPEDGGETEGKTQDEEESLEQLTDQIHEFLESFYMKYGGFIPLSEADVLDYLKKKGNPDLSNRGLDIKKEVTRYRAGLASAPIAGFMVTYNKHNLGLEDLGTLEDQNWLNDQIINMYGELIMEATQHKVHFFNSFFHKQLVAKGYDGVKRWTKKVDLFSKWLLLIPIHLEIHWSLVAVTMATKTISYYDSQGIVFRHTTDNIMKYLLSEAREKKQTAFQKGWKITIIKGIPQQKNDSDCGVFVLEYCRCLSVKQPLQFSQEDMPRIRKRIYKELCDCRLND